MTTNVLGQDKYNKYVDILGYYDSMYTRTLFLRDKPIVETLENPNKGYGPNYTGALGFPKIKSYVQIYAFMNTTPPKKGFYVCLCE